jgi:hypothetical protein
MGEKIWFVLWLFEFPWCPALCGQTVRQKAPEMGRQCYGSHAHQGDLLTHVTMHTLFEPIIHRNKIES